MIKFSDETGTAWNLMEDDENVVADAVAFLKGLGAKIFQTPAELLAYEREVFGKKAKDSTD